MNREDIIRMARDAGFLMENSAAIQAAERFAELVAAAEREACAKVCDDLHPGLATKRAAEIIRARGENT